MQIDSKLTPDSPGVAILQAEFKRCSPASGAWNRADDADAVRLALWKNQSSDNRKHSDGDFKAEPWEGASDQRVFLADQVVNEAVDVDVAAFNRALMRLQPTNMEDAPAAQVVTRLLQWLTRTHLNVSLQREVELSSQYRHSYGWTMLWVTWGRELGLRNEKVTLVQLSDLGVQLNLPLAELVMDAERKSEAAAVLGQLWDEYAKRRAEEAGIDADEAPTVKSERVRKALRELQEEGEAVVAMPYVCRSEPQVEALRPWKEVFVPDDFGDPQRGRVYVRRWFREEELRNKIRSEDWDEKWVEEAIKTKGKFSEWQDEGWVARSMSSGYKDNLETEQIEVLFAYTRRNDDDGVTGVYVTVFSAHVGKIDGRHDDECVGWHGLLDYAHGKCPFVILTREWWTRSATLSRGIPEVAGSMQRLEKVHQDAIVDRASLTTLPPRMVTPRMMDQEDVFGPGSRVPMLRGESMEFMKLPGYDGTAEKVMRYAQDSADRYFARQAPTVAPTVTQLRQQKMVNGFLGAWNEVFQQIVALCLQYMSPTMWQRVTNTPKPPVNRDEIAGEFDAILEFDVRELDLDYAQKQMQAISQFVLPEDSAGAIDRSKLVNLKLASISPTMARDLMQSKAGASQRIFEQVQSEMNSMLLGNPPRLVENEPTAGMQLQFAQQVVASNPNWTKALQENGRPAEALKMWTANRMQSVKQDKNKQTGRLGVDPEGMQ